MISISGYTLIRKLYQSSRSVIYQGYSQQDNIPVILKVLAMEKPTPPQIHQFQNEYNFTCKLKIKGVRCAVAHETAEGKPLLIMNYIKGITLKAYMNENQASLNTCLNTAMQIADALAEIHGRRIIHKDISPNNIIINPDDETVTIIDFGISSRLTLKMPHLRNPEHLEGTLSYISPEQTGRMNRTVDFRTDLYAFGATLYEFLAGHPPFEHDDPLSLVHAHIAKQPVPPIELIKQDSPFLKQDHAKLQALSDVIMKLLEKNAEDRYQSALGVRHDLEQITAISGKPGTVFQAGKFDISGQFIIPETLYGREHEVSLLLNNFDDLTGPIANSSLVLVSGFSGIGKTALVYEIHKPVTEKHGYFIQGKFDQYQQNIPYFALTNALNQFCRYILTESDENLNDWREKILRAVGDNGQVLIDIIPDLELVIGEQPPVPILGLQETQNRFIFYFQRFMDVISQAEHPLVIFMDDLQWADMASLNALKMIFQDPNIKHLLIIGAYRDNEVSPEHPLLITLDEMAATDIPVKNIILNNLTKGHVARWVADTLHCDAVDVSSLTELVCKETSGNPFFVRQFMQFLYEEGFIWFDYHAKDRKPKWAWAVDNILQKKTSDNVETLMINKISKQNPDLQNILQTASCIGNRFDLKTVAWATEKPVRVAYNLILQGIEAGFFVPADENFNYLEAMDEIQNSGFSFIHDRIQQTAYSMLPTAEKTRLHLKIGRLLLDYSPADENEDMVFSMVNQMNKGRHLITDRAEQICLIELNLKAGKKAKQATAYQGAFDYLHIALSMLPGNAWQYHYELTYTLHTEIISCAYLTGKFGTVDSLVKSALQHTRTDLDYVAIQRTQITALSVQRRFEEALGICLNALERLGITVPGNPTQGHVLLSVLQTKYHLRGKSMDDLFNLPQLQEEKVRMALSIILQTSSAMYFSNPLLLAVMGQKGIRLSLKYGYSAESGGLYSMYGLILIGKLRDHEQGMRFCELSLRITEKYGNSSLYARSHCLLYTLMGHWKYSMCNIPPKIMESYRLCIAVGETEFAAYTLLQYINHCLFVGINMPELLKQANTFTSQIRSMSQDNVLMHLKIPHQTILNLMGQNDVPYSLKGEILDEDTIKTHFKRTQDKIGLFVIHVRQILLSYLFGRYDLALQESIQAKKYVDVVMGIMEIPVFYFFDTLTRLAVLNKTSGRERLSHLLVIRKNKKMLRKWANMAPDNYAGKFYLVEAEAHRCSGDSGKAHECYQQAIRLAVKNGFQSDLALGYELAGRFYHDQEQRELAHFFLQHAYHAYHTWGATAKVLHLEKLYTDIKWHGISTDYIPQTAKSPLCSTWRDQSASTSNLSLDWQSVVKAAQTLSKEINLDKLLKQLMQMVIENAGAEHGYLFLPEDETWNIAAQGHADQEVRTDLPDAENLSDIMSMAIIKYVIRAKEYVVLDDAMNKGSFTHDDHIQQHRVKSVLCIPLISQGKLNGILYLENNLTTGAFSRDRLAVLKVLASQAAISIENAGLYDQLAGYNRTLEAKVAERTRELTIAREKAETANQAKSAFLTNMSHELRSPLNAILGYAGIMSNSSTLSRENRENAGVITRSGKHLLTLINQVLDLSKIEAGRTTLSNTDFNIHHLLHEVEEMFALKAENKHLQLVFERDDAVPQYIHADEIRLRQVLINLLNNAIKFTDKGGVAVRIKVKGEGSKVKGQRLKVKGEGTKSKGEEQDAESLSPLTLHL